MVLLEIIQILNIVKMPTVKIPKNIYESLQNGLSPVEVEAGEYLQTPDGSTLEVVGKKHSQGGEILNLPQSTIVVSDYLKIGSKLATYFKKNYDLNVTSKSTFATVLDRYKRKIGLTKILEEETNILQKLINEDNQRNFYLWRNCNRYQFVIELFAEISSSERF